MLDASDPLPGRPRRVSIAGVSGVGKTTLARRISEVLGAPHVELDSLYHGPNWTRRATFLEDVDRFLAGDDWVIEWQYREARSRILQRVELLVWLDLPYWRVTFPRIVRRTVTLQLTGRELWNGNVQPPLRTFLTDPDHIVRWSMRGRRQFDDLVPTLEGRFPGLTVVRLTRPRDVEAWVAGPLARAAGR